MLRQNWKLRLLTLWLIGSKPRKRPSILTARTHLPSWYLLIRLETLTVLTTPKSLGLAPIVLVVPRLNVLPSLVWIIVILILIFVGYGTSPSIFWVCNYQSQGNIPGQAVYQTGAEACSRCPSTHPHCISGLCSPGEPDGGSDEFGAMVFPSGDDTKENTTEPAEPEDFPPEEQLKRLQHEVEGINATSPAFHIRKQIQSLNKRAIPEGGLNVPGDCQDGRFHTWVTLTKGSFSDTCTWGSLYIANPYSGLWGCCSNYRCHSNLLFSRRLCACWNRS